jgi:DUF4097 and DUF4098 domain-containing protein YvlB
MLTYAQKGPLKGSGKVITKVFYFKDFDKISFEDFNGNIDIEIGKPYEIKIDIDDNLEPLLRVQKDDNENLLKIWLDQNKNGRLYLENVNIKIKVSMPESSVIKNAGNADLKIWGIRGRYFRLENSGNGDATLKGQIDELDIKKSGNGDVKAQNLEAKIAKVKSAGNGNVSVNSNISLRANGTGNGDILQYGHGQIETLSGVIGNGEVKKM